MIIQKVSCEYNEPELTAHFQKSVDESQSCLLATNLISDRLNALLLAALNLLKPENSC